MFFVELLRSMGHVLSDIIEKHVEVVRVIVLTRKGSKVPDGPYRPTISEATGWCYVQITVSTFCICKVISEARKLHALGRSAKTFNVV